MTPRTPKDERTSRAAEPRSAQRAGGERGSEIWTVLDLLQWTTSHFSDRGIESPRLDAECLLAYALGCDRLHLYIDYEKPVEEAERARFRELVRARAGDRVPVAYLTGRREFWSMPFAVNPSVLVPRPETECLVEAALSCVEPGRRVLELGTGSGAITIALAKERPDAAYWATDISSDALAVAQKNAQNLVPDVAIHWIEGDLFAPLGGERFDLVVSNPPYVAEPERAGLAPELRHEPASALFGGPDGCDVLRRIVAGAGPHLLPGASLLLELDPRQIDAIEAAAREAGFDPGPPIRDASGTQRALRMNPRRNDEEPASQPVPLEPS